MSSLVSVAVNGDVLCLPAAKCLSAARPILKIAQEMGGKQEENALLAEKFDQSVEFMGQKLGQIEN